MTFKELNISEPILRALTHKKYENPTPVQEKAIPPALEGHDLLGIAQTGTGKTAAFAIPIIQQLDEARAQERRHEIKALILTPTRELAIQIDESFRNYAKYTSLRHTVVFGGVNQRPQVDKLRHGIDILVATPGRLLDLINQGHISLSHIRHFVLDEADRMLDMPLPLFLSRYYEIR
jgi:ATP-dependent RNA helicase RhlE